MWNLSYLRIAEQDLAAARAQAAHEALIAQLPRPVRGRRPVRSAVGGFLIRVGFRLVMPPTPPTASTAR